MDSDVRWDDLRIAYQVAASGSLSKAGATLGVNHSTVLRAVNRLENTLGANLFIRHQRGYQLTDAGRIMAERMTAIHGDMQRLTNALATLEASPSGLLRISTVIDFSTFFAPLLHEFRKEYPQVRIKIVATDEILTLAKGEVHVAIRLGSQPSEPDLVARPLSHVDLRFYASPTYIEEFGIPRSKEDINQHNWVLPTGDKERMSGIQELLSKVNASQLVMQSNSFNDIQSSVEAGVGIGPLSSINAEKTSLVEVDFGVQIDSSPMWFVYHKDMKQSKRIRALQEFLLRKIS